MTLTVYFIVTISVSLCLGSEEYVQLISNIYEFSNRTSVTLIHFGSTDDSSKKQLIFDTQVLLLKKGFPVSNTNFKKLDSIKKKEYDSVDKFYGNDKILIVFFVSSMQDFSDMLHITKLMKRKKVITFLLFVKIDDSPDLPSCMNPVGNPLRLGRGVSVLVKCYEDPDIREWHSVNNNEILIKERATWDFKRGFTSKSRRLVFGDREFLRGKTLLAASISETDTMGNYLSMICVALEEAGKFKIKKTHIVVDYGILDERTNTWDGAVSLIMNNTVDIAVGFFTFLPSELLVVDFSIRFIRAEFAIIIRKPESKVLVSWSAYFEPLSLQVWIIIIFTVILLQIVCILMKNTLPTQCYEKSSYADDFFNIYGIFCHQEVIVTTSATSLRILYTSVVIFSFFIWSIYSARFVSRLTVVDSNVKFRSMEEFVKVKTHKLIVFKETGNYFKLKNATESTFIEAAKLLVSEDQLPTNNDDAVEMICKQNMALYLDDIFVPLMYHNNVSNLCPMLTIGTGDFDSFAFLVNKHSPYKAAINYYLRRFHENGMLPRMKPAIYSPAPKIEEFDNQFTSVTAVAVAMIFTMLFASFIVSIIMLLFEKLYFFLERTNEKNLQTILNSISRKK
ncbi:glutamate receptor-like [Leptopilina heterotoma]|uniref:glutamate receptor-like n=1 Tax=Leptopilina heterotoma TaxID=63436 RepID=UPI001CA8612F|nr:glutamate receptor-like [Leptopilina heterotoma]